MAKLGLVKCRICGKPIDRNTASPDEWIMPSRNFFYHSKCYSSWKSNMKDLADDLPNWESLLFDYIVHEMRQSYSFFQIHSQIGKFIKENQFTGKGIYLTFRYLIEIKKLPYEEKYGIGAVKNYYWDAAKYWNERDSKQHDVLQLIEDQMQKRNLRKTVSIAPQKKIITQKNHLDEKLEAELSNIYNNNNFFQICFYFRTIIFLIYSIIT